MIEALPDAAMYGIDTANALAVGLPADLPAEAPEFVSKLLETIGAHAEGSMEGLGEAVSEIASGADPSSASESADVAETAGAGEAAGAADAADAAETAEQA